MKFDFQAELKPIIDLDQHEELKDKREDELKALINRRAELKKQAIEASDDVEMRKILTELKGIDVEIEVAQARYEAMGEASEYNQKIPELVNMAKEKELKGHAYMGELCKGIVKLGKRIEKKKAEYYGLKNEIDEFSDEVGRCMNFIRSCRAYVPTDQRERLPSLPGFQGLHEAYNIKSTLPLYTGGHNWG